MVINIAGYRFVNLPDRDGLREPMLDVCLEAGLKGTVLLSPNGINFFLAGTEAVSYTHLTLPTIYSV